MILRHGPPEGMLLHDLGELLLMSRANVTGLIDHLEEKGMVKRVVDTSDRRARFARITRKGETLLDEVAPRHFQRIANRLRNFTAEERDALVLLLTKLRREMLAATGTETAPDKVDKLEKAETGSKY
jgi:MarR family 2-MHQ and catechol resistance regulon transcriptional repressor